MTLGAPATLGDAQLTAGQRTLLTALATSELAEQFHLSGATALAAFFLRHRRSADLDLFCAEPVDLLAVQAFLAGVPGLTIDRFHRHPDRWIFLTRVREERVEVEFTRFPFLAEAGPLRVGGLRLESPRDALLNKLHAMCGREDGKDDVDVYLLLERGVAATLAEPLAAAERKFGLPGMPWILQRRLLRVPNDLPPTTPVIERAALVARFRAEAEGLIPHK